MGIMRRAVAGLTAFVAAGSLLACGDVARGPTGPNPSGSPLLDVSANRAITTTSNQRIPIAIVVFVPCANGGAGEPVALQGDLHLLSHVTISNSGNLHVKTHAQPMGVSGVGLVTGDKYQGTGVTQSEFSSNAPLPFEQTFINNFRIIGQGPGNNLLLHTTFHITVNANGAVTAEVLNTSTECK